MPLYKPSELRAFLHEIGASPKRSLSQNFLIDGNIIRKITQFARLKAGDPILEIGPGPGVLTEALLAQGAHVIAIEKDKKFANALYRLQTEDRRLTVIEGDALTPDFASLLKPKTKLIANLPYHITTPLLTRLLPMKNRFDSITAMVQKEVANRFVASPSTKEYGSITVFLNFYSTVEYGFTVEPTCFYPPPRVKSAVVKLSLKTPPEVEEESFFAMTRTAFQGRRKMVRSTLKKKYPLDLVEQGLKKMGKELTVRPENLSLDDFLVLFKEIDK